MDTRKSIHQLRTWVGQGIIGQREVIDHLLIAILANRNVLMEGLPGLAKTRGDRCGIEGQSNSDSIEF